MDLSKLIAMFEEADQASVSSSALARKCRRYYSGEQLTQEEESELARRGQPAIVINLIRKEVNWMLGYEMQSRTDPRAFPRNPDDEGLADVASDALRFVSDATKYDKLRSRVWENLVIEGTAGAEVLHSYRGEAQEPCVKINMYPADRLFADPHSRETDFSDARYKGAVIWSDAEAIKLEYPGKEDVIDASVGAMDASNETFEDRPYFTAWSDNKRNRVRQVLIYYRDGGVWHWARFVRGGILEQGEVEYRNEYGESECPFIMGSVYVSEDNTRHGVVVDYLDPQDEVNKRRAKLLHQMTTRQTWGVKGSVGSVAAMKRELAKPDGHVEVTKEAADDARESGVMPFNIIPAADHASGQFQLYQESRANIEALGANAALQGASSQRSGRAIMAEQQGGLVEIAPIYDRLKDFDLEVYRQMWLRVQQTWTDEKWVRVTDDDEASRFVALNRPVTLAEELGSMPPEEASAVARRYQLQPNDPRLQMPVRIENQVGKMDLDIVIDDAPDAVTLQGETFEQLVGLASSMPGSIPPEILVEAAPNLDRKLKQKLLEAMQQQREMQMQMQQAGMQAEAQKEQARMQIDAQKAQAGALRDAAQAQKTEVETAQMAAGLR